MNRDEVTHEELYALYVQKIKEVENYRALLYEREMETVRNAEDYAAPIIETTIAAMAACREMFDDYYYDTRRESIWQRLKRWWRNVW